MRRRCAIVFIVLAVSWTVFNGLVGSADKSLSTDEAGPYRQPYRFTKDWFTSRIPLWERVLSPWQGAANLQYLEIGVYEGRSALWMLEHVLTHPSSRLTAVDIFPRDLKERFLANVRLSGFAKKVTVITGRSQTELRRLPLRHFDIIYVDGSHRAGDVFADAVLSWELLKPGGLLMFDDYHWYEERFPEELRPHIAIDAFLTLFRDSLDVVHRGAQVIVKKRRNPCEGVEGCTPLGSYRYFWMTRELHDQRQDAPIELTEQEKAFIERLVKSRKFGMVSFLMDQDLSGNEAFHQLMKRLGLDSLIGKPTD